jgi:folate-binding Fe-S cluster repair protein YgfZ
VIQTKHGMLVPHRTIIQLTGMDVFKLLQSLCTNQIERLKQGESGLYTAFLNAKVKKDQFIME